MEIEVKNLSFSYSGRRVLSGISFTARQGELLSILGSNGVGKSTLFKCMLSLLRTYTGSVLVDGRDTRTMSVRELAGCIAYIPQNTAPTFNYSVEDIVLMGTTAGLSTFRMPRDEEMERVALSLKRTGIEHLRQRCFHHLSGGERQLVIIARALAQNAGILMLDEPTASLDFANQMLVLRQAAALAKEGYTVIQTTHNPEHSYMFSDRIVAIRDGKVLTDGTPREAVTSETMSALYGTAIRTVSLEDDRVRVCLPGTL